MEEGSLRCDANVSIRPAGQRELGTKTELKNMNSFRFLEKGIRAEIARQEALLRAGEEVVQETLHFDPRTETLTPLRSKEEAHDYRYFPEPDLVPVTITPEMLDRAKAALPELPAARAERFERDLGLSADSAKLLAWRAELGDYFETALRGNGPHPPEPAAAGQLGQRARGPHRRRRPGRVARRAGGARHARRDGHRAPGHPERGQAGPRHSSSPKAATRERSSSARAWARSAAATRSSRSSSRRSTRTPTSSRSCARAT